MGPSTVSSPLVTSTAGRPKAWADPRRQSIAGNLVHWQAWLAACVALIFLGRGYQYFFFDAPLRALIWDEGLLSAFIGSIFGISWSDFVRDPLVMATIMGFIRLSGIVVMLGGVAALLRLKWQSRLLELIVWAAFLLCSLYVLLDTREHFGQVAHFFEHAIQLGTPLLLLVSWAGRLRSTAELSFAVKALVAVTFAAHGLYALGIYPLPGHFVDMTILTLGVSESLARQLLWTVGVLDLLAAIALFWPPSRTAACLYMLVWGTATACARLLSGFVPEDMLYSLHQSLHQTIFRLPHGLLPLALLLLPSQFYARSTQHVRSLPRPYKPIPQA